MFEKTLWILLISSVVVALFGYGFFTLRPGNLARFSGVAGLHVPAMVWGAQLQSALFVVLLFWRGVAVWGWSMTLRLLVLLSLVGFVAEWVGTGTGLPFGAYHYTEMLGYKIGGSVPWVIPPSWFSMGIPCYVLAHACVEGFSSKGWGPRLRPKVNGGLQRPTRLAGIALRVALGGWLLMTWDLVLDPAMSHLLPYWQWDEPGFYYSSPFLNFVGWFLVGALIMGVIEWVQGPERTARLPVKWASAFYLLNVVLSAGMCLLAGELFAVLVTIASGLLGIGFVYVWAQVFLRSEDLKETRDLEETPLEGAK